MSFIDFICDCISRVYNLLAVMTFAISIILCANKWLIGSFLFPAKTIMLTEESGDLKRKKKKKTEKKRKKENDK